MPQAQRNSLSFSSFEQFLAWEQGQDVRHDLIDGVPVAMAGGSEAHDDISFNVHRHMRETLQGGPCKAFSANMPVKTGYKKGRYPDVTVDCGPRHPGNLSASAPTVVFEVLSPDSRGQDFTEKLWEYNSVNSIAHYVLLEQSEPHAYIYDRSATGDFPLKPREIQGIEGCIDLPALGLALPMAVAYSNVAFVDDLGPDAPAPAASPWHR